MLGKYMLRTFGTMWWKLFLLVCLSYMPLVVRADLPLIAMDGKKIVTASTVRVRAQPLLTSDVVGHVGLGAVFAATKRTKNKLQHGAIEHYWYFITAPQLSGWVSGRFLNDFTADKKEKIWFDLIKTRLDNPQLSFRDRMALYKFTDLVANNSQDEKLKGAFELGRLLALQKSFEPVNYSNEKKEPYASWIAAHRPAKRIFHDEISGQWLVSSLDYWKLADKHKGQASGDEIAWYAANAQLGGECEGDIACNLGREKITQGEYLLRYPLGRYANVSLQRLSETLTYIQDALKDEPRYFLQASESGEVIDSLVTIIKDTNPKLRERAKAVEQIKSIQMTFNNSRR